MILSSQGDGKRGVTRPIRSTRSLIFIIWGSCAMKPGRSIGFVAAAVVLSVSVANVRVSAEDFPRIYNTERDASGPLSAEKAAASFRTPPGFHVSVFAAEPDVMNPIAMTWDSRGRIWVAENYTYSERAVRFDLNLRDRVLILEDSDGDGKCDRRTVFTDQVQTLTSVEIGLGGVWLMCPPRLLFIPDRDGDDRPDGPARVVLDGFTVPEENYHNFANGLRWGPDGDLYGRCGASSPGLVGPPGSASADRVPLAGGLWRFSPRTKRFEALAHGVTNPWGHDWNEFGEPFFINTVNGHLWHAIAGMHFVRPHTIDPNPHVYELIDQHADHWHWDESKDWTDSRSAKGEHDKKGGGHAHIGAMIYQANRWPENYRGRLFTLNMHGRRANVDRLDRTGSGYIGRHEADVFFAADTWFRGMEISQTPDGNAFVLDWSDSGECHENDGVHRTSGRIYKIWYGDQSKPKHFDLTKADEVDLVGYQRDPNDWFARRARRVLADRAASGEKLENAIAAARKMIEEEPDPVRKLRAAWTLQVLREPSDNAAIFRSLLKDKHESVRAWGIRLLTEDAPLDDVLGKRPAGERSLPRDLLSEFVRVASDDDSALVRLILASTLGRLTIADRAALAEPLLKHKEDSSDHNLPLLIWYGLIPIADSDPATLALLGEKCELATTRRLIARRLAEDLESRPVPLDRLLAASASSESQSFRGDVITGVWQALRGRRKAPRPAAWESVSKSVERDANPEIETKVRELGVVFGEGRALDEIKKLALDDHADIFLRQSALESLIAARPVDLRSICERLLGVRFLNKTAARGLAGFDDPAIGSRLAASYRAFHPSERSAVIDALVSRPSFASALLDALATGKIPRGDVSAFQARQIREHGDPRLTRKLGETWGEIHDTPADRKAQIDSLRKKLNEKALAGANLGEGRLIFNKVCSSCHKLYGYGGSIGPDLTGAGRDNLEYLLENVVDPAATVNADFKMTVVALRDGRVLNGLIRNRNERTLTLQTQNEAVVVDRSDIEAERPSDRSLMPDGLASTLSDEQIRDLFAYLKHQTQVALPAEKPVP